MSKTVISGYGCISAAGLDALSGHRAVENAVVRNKIFGSEFFPGDFTGPFFQVVGEDLDHRFHIQKGLNWPEHEVNRTIKLALVATLEALVHANLSLFELRTKRVGIALGTTVGCTFHNEDYYIDWRDGRRPDPAPLYTYLSANLASSIQSILGVTGPRLVITNACASGTDAIGVAKGWLEYDHCDIAIAGGADGLSRVASYGFNSLMLVSSTACRPFDVDRKGLNLGEGSGILLLEPEDNVKKKKGPFYGWLRGYGAGGDGHHPTAPHHEGRGLQRAVKNALVDAGIGRKEISLINAHGTGTTVNDLAETTALAHVGFKGKELAVVSTKGATGHTLGAAGGVEAVYALLTLNKGIATGTVGCREPDPELRFPILPEGERFALPSRIGISQSLAFGGGNSAIVIEGVGS